MQVRSPSNVRQLTGAGIAGTEDLPPRYTATFSQEEFVTFISDPTAVLEKLGYKVDNITVAIRDSAWMAKERKWTEARVLRDLPSAQHWRWECGYEDEMCVCYRVLDI